MKRYERFIKLDKSIYTEVEIQGMSLKEVNVILDEVDVIIQDIQYKKKDFMKRDLNFVGSDEKKFSDVVKSFEIAILVLQKQRGWIREIKAKKESEQDIEHDKFFREFYKAANCKLNKFSINRVLKQVSHSIGEDKTKTLYMETLGR